MSFKLFTGLNLQLFSDGTASGSALGASNGSEGTNLTENVADKGGQSAKTGEKVFYGKVKDNSSDAGKDNNEVSKSREQAYNDFKAQYKDLFDIDAQNIVKSRLRGHKELQARFDAQKPIMDALMMRYGKETEQELLQALENDNSFYIQEADRLGLDVDEYKERLSQQRESAIDKRELSQLRAEKQARELYSSWLSEAKEVKEKYPEFDLDLALSNPQFRSLISQKNPEYRPSMTQVYELLNLDKIKENTKHVAQKETVANVLARGARPNEAGAKAQPGAVYKSDVSKLTKADRKEILRRVSMGETIEF